MFFEMVLVLLLVLVILFLVFVWEFVFVDGMLLLIGKVCDFIGCVWVCVWGCCVLWGWVLDWIICGEVGIVMGVEDWLGGRGGWVLVYLMEIGFGRGVFVEVVDVGLCVGVEENVELVFFIVGWVDFEFFFLEDFLNVCFLNFCLLCLFLNFFYLFVLFCFFFILIVLIFFFVFLV